MAEIPYIPTPQYTGHQVIITSDRVTLHSRNDSVMLFGKKAIALSSLGTVNLDVSKKVIINSPKIELGLSAERLGEPVLLGKKTVQMLSRLLDALTLLSTSLSTISNTKLETSIPGIVKSSKALAELCPKLRSSLKDILSEVTYTK
jgi:hypothetical protein